MSLGLLPGDLVGAENCLDPVPDFHGDQGFVESVVAGSFEGDLPLVVGVGEHPVDGGQGGCLGRAFGCCHRGQAPVDQFFTQRDGGVVAGGVGLEGPLDQRGTVGVWLNDSHFAAQFVAFGDVEVSDGCFAVGATGLCLLGHALGDLVGEVAAVELGDGGHDAVNEHAAGGFVDVLGGGDEDDPGLFQGQVDHHVVGAVAGQAVDFVDDAVGDLVGLDVLDHAQQFGPVGLASRLARVHELFHDDGVEVAGFTEVGFALGGDREAFVASAAFGLFLGGDPQVGHRQAGGLTDVVEVVGCRRWCSDGHGSCFPSPTVGPTRAAPTARAVRLVRKTGPGALLEEAPS
ncbi:MAG: hypothetical protein QM695_14800 [Micropruina sp.]